MAAGTTPVVFGGARALLLAFAATGALAPPLRAQAPPAAPPPTAGAAEVPEAVLRELQTTQEALAKAELEFEGTQQSRSIVLFDEIITRLEAVGPRALPARGRDMLADAYEYRARAYYGIGLQEKASESFRLLIQLKPDRALSKEKVSPKIVDLFNSVKRALVGYLAVSSRPAGARVTLVGTGGTRTDLGLTDFFPVEVLAGEYTVEIVKAGYQTETRPLSIAARATETLAGADLVRVLASVFFVTEPAGVEVWVDGELKATTAGQPRPRAARGGARAGARPREGLGPHRGREPLARQPRRRAAPEVLRDDAGAPSTPRQAQDYEPRAPASSRTRSPRCASPPTRRARASS